MIVGTIRCIVGDWVSFCSFWFWWLTIKIKNWSLLACVIWNMVSCIQSNGQYPLTTSHSCGEWLIVVFNIYSLPSVVEASGGWRDVTPTSASRPQQHVRARASPELWLLFSCTVLKWSLLKIFDQSTWNGFYQIYSKVSSAQRLKSSTVPIIYQNFGSERSEGPHFSL